ncbi:MAG: dihydrolipoyl dehydrogenase [Erysipelotrichaceae bacterium]|nr:dihydrolipoyl dehydrogenase [Erysipelotrichaceae bacterium]
MKYDVMIIGGGPGGYTAANHAAVNGLKTVLFEKNKLGGTCLNRGCIPMKSLIQSAKIYDQALNSELYGVKAESVTYASDKVNERRDNVVENLRNGIEKGLLKSKVEIVYGEAVLKDRNTILCNGETYEGDNIVIAAGSTVFIPPIEGKEYALSSDDILETDHTVPESMIIIGGGVIGVELADAYATLGSKITIIEMADHILPNMDKEIAQRLSMFLKKKNVEIYTSAKVEKINEDHSVVFTDKKEEKQTISASEVLVAAGRKADVSQFMNNDIGLNISRGIEGDDSGRTAVDNIYVIGDAKAGNIQLAHVAEAQGANVIETILGKKEVHDTKVIPSCIYTEPEIACVGMGEDELKKQGIEYSVKKVLTGANGKCLIENSESGFVKLITVDDVIVGAQIITPHATEMIAELAVAVENKMKLSDLQRTVHPHPTISEMIWDAAK